jgi:hypothetical protein
MRPSIFSKSILGSSVVIVVSFSVVLAMLAAMKKPAGWSAGGLIRNLLGEVA